MREGYISKNQLRPQKRLFSLQDTSIYLGRSINGVRQMLWDGKRIFIDLKDIEIWIEKNKTTNVF